MAYKHVMIDLETTGLRAGCKILSIGAVGFGDDFVDIGNSFYDTIDQESYPANELLFWDDPKTLEFWNGVDPEVKKDTFSGKSHVHTALMDLYKWNLNYCGDKTLFWANGSAFDLPILEYVYEKLSLDLPWKPFNDRCYRTLKNLLPNVKLTRDVNSLKHNALADATYQAKHCVMLLKVLEAMKED